MKARPKPQPIVRPQQQTPKDIVDDLMGVIRRQFYCDAPPKQWFQDQSFIRRRVVLWPAHWLNERGVTLRPERYKGILLEILQGIKHHGEVGAVRFWPGYLAHCVQQHFKHNEEAIYNEGKALRATLETVLLAAQGAVQSRPADPVATLSDAYDLLKVRKRSAAPRQRPAGDPQLSLL